MPRWLRIVRGMIGTGVTFAVGVGAVGSMLGLAGILLGQVSGSDLLMVVRVSAIAFLVGVGFAGVLAVFARRRTFERLSLRFVSSLGAGGGLLYFLFIAAMNGARVWSVWNALGNLAILTLLGAGSAAATLLLARTAGRARPSGDSAGRLGEGIVELPLVTRETERSTMHEAV